VCIRQPLRNADGEASMKRFVPGQVIVVAILSWIVPVASSVSAADWPTYRGDNQRTGGTTEPLAPPLTLKWVFRSHVAPRPAWPMPAEELPRAHSDNAFHVAIAQGAAYFGSSVDDKVFAIELSSGKVRWAFTTEGPVRFAPSVSGGRVYFGSDDGYVYCLDAHTGKRIWRRLVGPNASKVIGNGRMISTWPVRTSVLVDGGNVFATAGVFPLEGVYVCCLAAADGKVIWSNDEIGGRSHELAFGGISPQGYLLASETTLYVPSGRAMPAAFDRQTGRMLFYAKAPGKRGGTWAMLDGNRLLAGVDSGGTPFKAAYNATTGKFGGQVFLWGSGGIDMALTAEAAQAITPDGVAIVDRRAWDDAGRRIDRAEAELARIKAITAATNAGWNFPDSIPLPDVSLSALTATKATSGRGQVSRDKSVEGNPLRIGGLKYARGMGVHCPSELAYPLKSTYRLFVAAVGVDDETGKRGSVVFKVLIDGREVSRTAQLSGTDGYWNVYVPIPAGSKKIRLLADPGDDGDSDDHANWANAGFATRQTTPVKLTTLTDEQKRRKIKALTTQAAPARKTLSKARSQRVARRLALPGQVSVIRAGSMVLAGGKGEVTAIDAGTLKKLWVGKIDGRAVGLAVGTGCLLVSSDTGGVYCFAAGPAAQPKTVDHGGVSKPPVHREDVSAAVRKIVAATGLAKGYCLVRDCASGLLAVELARATELKIIALTGDAGKLQAVRDTVAAAGLLGVRIAVEPWGPDELPDYFANLIVSEGDCLAGKSDKLPQSYERLLRPEGGTAVSFQRGPDGLAVRKTVRGKLAGGGSWRALYANLQNTACSDDTLVHGPLGLLWYGEPGPLGMVERHGRAMSPLALGGRMFIQGAESLMACDAYNGTVLWKRDLPGAVRVRVDVDGGNMVISEAGLFVAAFDKCHRLAPATGKTIGTYELPQTDGKTRLRWGYLAVVGDVVLGTTAKPLQQPYAAIWGDILKVDRDRRRGIEPKPDKSAGANPRRSSRQKGGLLPPPNEDTRRTMQRTGEFWRKMARFPSWGSRPSPAGEETGDVMGGDCLFARDVKTGKLLWRQEGNDIPNICIAVDDGVVYFAAFADDQQRQTAAAELKRLAPEGVYKASAKSATGRPDVRYVTAVKIDGGKVLWRKAVDVTGCGGDRTGMALRNGVLLLFGHYSNHDTGYFKRNQLKWRRITALSTADGSMLWSRPLNYLRRPLLVGDTIIIEPRACDVRTGKIKMRTHPITGEQVPWEFLRPGHSCGVTSASADALFYRSYCGATVGLTDDSGLSLFGAIRPGCWINMIPVGGVMLMPEASSGCTCSFPIRCSIALVPKPARLINDSALLIDDAPVLPVKDLAVNFGATADARDSAGKMWLAYPRLKAFSSIGYGAYGLKFDMKLQIADGMGFFCKDFRRGGAGGDAPWLASSGCAGLLACEVPLADRAANTGDGLYRVRLGFVAPAGDKPGRRVFDLMAQGKTVLAGLDVVKAAGGCGKVLVREIGPIRAGTKLTLKFVPRAAGANRAPVVNFMEVIRVDDIAAGQ